MEQNNCNIVGKRYQINQRLGGGAMGEVYLVTDKKLHKLWAMKRCRAVNDAEVKMLKKIEHRAFPRIVDVVQEGGEYYLIMDYIKGKTLKSIIEYRLVNEKEIIAWGIAMAEAIFYLHKMTPPVCYMDCKPENIMLTEENEIKLVDVGSAYQLNRYQEGERISGTRFYAPVEQTAGITKGCIDERTDIYSFGMTMYVLLVGKEREYRDRDGRLCVRAGNPAISRGMCSLVQKCSENNPGKRFQSMEEVIDALKQLQQNKKSVLLPLFSGRKGYRYETKLVKSGLPGKRLIFMVLFLGLIFGGRICHAMEQSSFVEETEWRIKLYDMTGRNILIRDGYTWEVNQDICIRIPIEEIEGKPQIIRISSIEEAGKQAKSYQFKCVRKK